jgi:1-aminocyclopropane-1-carboxylate deaminase/D-cysteine desulfhydrase-like pyridoxal-dependent ACC family enzyme
MPIETLPRLSETFGRITFVIKRDNQTGLAFGGGTVTFKLTLRPRAQCDLRDATKLIATGAAS